MTDALAAIVGTAHVRPAAPEDAIDGVQPRCVIEPADEQEVSAILTHCSGHELKVAPRGGGTKLGWGNPPSRLDVVLSLARLDALVEHADGDMTATVQAGMTLAALQACLAERGQTLALDVPDADRATIGGLIATNDSGALRLRYGGIRDQLLGITLVRSDGVVAHGGGRVVKNVAGYDLPKLLTGSLGALGVITQATFRVYPLPAETRRVAITVASPAAGGQVLRAIQDSTLVPTELTLRRFADGVTSVSVTFSGISASVEAQMERFAETAAVRSSDLQSRYPGFPVWGQEAGVTRLKIATTSGGSVLKLSVLPTEIPAAMERAAAIGERHGWPTEVELHAHGLGHVTWNRADDSDALVAAITELRTVLAPRGGTAVILQAPLEVKGRLDIWGPATDAVPLMRRVKAELDPTNTLNPGRLIGGI